MRNLLTIILIAVAGFCFAQNSQNSFERKGLVFGLGLGAGTLHLTTKNGTESSSQTFSNSFPNLKIGYMINDKMAILAMLPRASYSYNGKDRGMEALVVAGQYWISDRHWLLGGAGITLDLPAFYTIKKISDSSYYPGFPTIVLGTGYEIWRRGRFALDIQYRLQYSKSNIHNGYREGLANMIMVGFNWY